MKARENPFRIECLHGLRYRFLSGSLETMLSKLRTNGNRGAIIGPHGTGKTTLITELSVELQLRGEDPTTLQLTEASRSTAFDRVSDWIDAANAGQFLLLDGAEQLGYLVWRRFERRTRIFRGLVITAHGAGRLPTIYECQSTSGLLQELVADLQGADRCPTDADLQRLFARHGGNVRNCLRELYDRHV